MIIYLYFGSRQTWFQIFSIKQNGGECEQFDQYYNF